MMQCVTQCKRIIYLGNMPLNNKRGEMQVFSGYYENCIGNVGKCSIIKSDFWKL